MCNIYHTHVLIYSIERSVPAISFNAFKHTYNEKIQLKLTKIRNGLAVESDCFCRRFFFSIHLAGINTKIPWVCLLN